MFSRGRLEGTHNGRPHSGLQAGYPTMEDLDLNHGQHGISDSVESDVACVRWAG